MKHLIFGLIVGCLAMANTAFAQEGMTPRQWKKAMENKEYEKSEVWEPEPPKVTPGYVNSLPPSDAVVLFDGKNLDNFRHGDGSEAKWTVAEGAFAVKPGTGDIFSKQGFGDIQLHLEWKAPIDTAGLEGQARGNSGVFFMEQYEVQILDSYNNRTYSNGQAGAIYKDHIPTVNACKPPGDWQTYDIIFTAPHFNDDGTVKSPAYITVIHNGVLIQNHKAVKGRTFFIAEHTYEKHADKLPIKLQDHGNTMSFRNIWVREL